MKVVATHRSADFDALASMVGARKLYPGALALLPDSLNTNVQDFARLYRDKLDLKQPSEIDMSGIQLLIVTDTMSKGRLGSLSGQLEAVPNIHVYDHHEGKGDLDAAVMHHENTGATTTIILEKLLDADRTITPFEATLFALGIYEDTGCMTFSSTTVRDVAAVCRLWEFGLDLGVLNQFLFKPLDENQRSILEELLASTEYHEIRGAHIAITRTTTSEFVGGLSILTHKLLEIEDVDVVFSVVAMKDRVFVVGRSRSKYLDLSSILSALGGQGHISAASATIKNETQENVREKLLALLYQKIRPLPKVKEIMSAPVKTVAPQTRVDEAKEMMLRYGHGGFPVFDNGGITGIVSRRDLEKAVHHNLGHAPVKGYMSKTVRTVEPETTVRQARGIMVKHNVGRLPVISGDRLVGIITRTDILRSQDREENDVQAEDLPPMPLDNNLTKLINTRLPRKVQSLLLLVGQKAGHEKVRVYAVGGFVRDLLLGGSNQDIDLVVEGDALPFARSLSLLLGGGLEEHEKFGTARLRLADGVQLDIVASRQEFYAHPGALPEVERSNLRSDLYRRDFTVNTLACSLNTDDFGSLIDFFNGVEDLHDKKIRVLYNLSFVEDPLRILRAIRFEKRLGFTIEENTLSLIKSAVRSGVLEKVSRERLYDEIKLAVNEEKAPEIIDRFFELNVGLNIFPGVSYTEKSRKRLFAAREMLSWAERAWPDANPNPLILYISLLLLDLPFQEARHLCRKIRLKRTEKERVTDILESLPRLLKLLQSGGLKTPSEIESALAGQPVETMLALQLESKVPRVWEVTSLYWEKLRSVKCEVGGNDLLELGFKPGPYLGKVLEAVRKACLDGSVLNKEEELRLVKELMNEYNTKGDLPGGTD